jgi:hypothetical protein
MRHEDEADHRRRRPRGEGQQAENLAPENLAPENLAPENLAPENLAPEDLAPETLVGVGRGRWPVEGDIGSVLGP